MVPWAHLSLTLQSASRSIRPFLQVSRTWPIQESKTNVCFVQFARWRQTSDNVVWSRSPGGGTGGEVCIFTVRTAVERERDVLNGRYVQLLVQEVTVKVEVGFLLSLLAVFKYHVPDDREEFARSLQKFVADVSSTKLSLVSEARESPLLIQQHHYDYIHLTPIKVPGKGSARTVIEGQTLVTLALASK